MKNAISIITVILFSSLAQGETFNHWVVPEEAVASDYTVWGDTWYTGPAEYAIDENPITSWTLNSMGWIEFDLGSPKLIRSIRATWGGSVSNGNVVNIYIDGVKVLSEEVFGATTNTRNIYPRTGRFVRYETVPLPHNEWQQVATWSELSEFRVLVEVEPPEPPSVSIAHAVRLSWQTEVGFTYFPQTSHDLTNWNDIGISFSGDGSEKEYFYTTGSPNSLFFRIRIE